MTQSPEEISVTYCAIPCEGCVGADLPNVMRQDVLPAVVDTFRDFGFDERTGIAALTHLARDVAHSRGVQGTPRDFGRLAMAGRRHAILNNCEEGMK